MPLGAINKCWWQCGGTHPLILLTSPTSTALSGSSWSHHRALLLAISVARRRNPGKKELKFHLKMLKKHKKKLCNPKPWMKSWIFKATRVFTIFSHVYQRILSMILRRILSSFPFQSSTGNNFKFKSQKCSKINLQFNTAGLLCKARVVNCQFLAVVD